MTAFFTLLSPTGTIAAIVVLYILARLSKKLGAVTRMAPYYRWYWVGMASLLVGLMSQFLRITVLLAGEAHYSWFNAAPFYLFTYHLPVALGVTIGLVVTWRYWSWLLREQD